MATTRTKYIGAGTTITTILALLIWLMARPDISINVSGDIFCDGTVDPCISYFDVTSLNSTFYFQNKGGLNLDFSPKIKSYQLCIDDKRCKKCGLCPVGFRPIYLNESFSGSGYVLKLEKGKTRYFAVVGYKINQEDTIKWSIDTRKTDIDPVWYGVNITKLCDYKIIQKEVWITKWKEIWDAGNSTWKNVSYSEIGTINETVCNKAGYSINDKFKINLTRFPYDCEKNGKCLECVSLTDGAHLGKYVDCGSGKSCIKACLTTDGKINITEKNSEDEWSKVSKSYIAKKLEVEQI